MIHDDPDPELAQATGELYQLDPAEFVPARNELVRRLRTGGDRDLARRVAQLRRPSPAAWAVNQLARRHPEDFEALLRLGEELRAAQTRTLGGADAAQLREAGRARREAVARLAASAIGLLAERGPGAGAHHAEVAATLEAASLDPQAAAKASSGRLTTSLEPPSGFGDLGLDAPLPVADAAPPLPDQEREEPTDAESAAEATEQLARAKRAAADAREVAAGLLAEAREAVELAAQRDREVDEAEAEVARRQRALDEARRRADAAHRDADRAQRAAARAEWLAAEAAEQLRRAERRRS